MSSAVSRALEGYVAGRVPADVLVAAVALAYYRETGGGRRDALRPVMDIVERWAPGVVELAGAPDGPGFDVRLAERPFPQRREPDLRRAAAAALRAWRTAAGEEAASPPHHPGWISRLAHALRRWFSAGA